MADVLAGRGCSWEFESEFLRIKPDSGKASKLLSELGERVVPHEAIAEVTLTPGKRGTVVLRAEPRRGADPLMTAAAGQLKEAADPYRLVLPAGKESLADYYADELRSALTDRGPATRFLVAPPEPPRAFKGWDGAAAFDGDTITLTWFWSGATSAKYAAGDQRYTPADLEGVDWHAPDGASGCLRLRVRGRRPPPEPDKDPAAVVFGLGWGATHKSLPFAAAVLAAIPAPEPKALPSAVADVAGLIAKLGELRDAGLLTEEEFRVKKAELLSRI
ncbi:DUF4429 domain-containing protein [Nonomuraea diastatica]|uniref:DUF4429 domain-containing protein n=1 Tax=Nonomuraea diastatica TaxID=1848329 RepID=A0A4R4WLR6_9ACTN|nr:DUF4429 domain-containing protein [Nonomuraea diastatica]TDD20012.1 DUF4429 domain-containing protein [Nonomuraea diastatica]